MMVRVFCRFATLLLILSLVLGQAGSGMRAASMTAIAAPVAMSAIHAPGNCNDCTGNSNGVLANACSVYCAGMIAVSPDVATIDHFAADTRRYDTPRILTGHRISPDPHPPKTIVLS
jgi:hypothetical protein